MTSCFFNELSLVHFSVVGGVPVIMEKVNGLCFTHKTRLTQSHCCELYSIQEP